MAQLKMLIAIALLQASLTSGASLHRSEHLRSPIRFLTLNVESDQVNTTALLDTDADPCQCGFQGQCGCDGAVKFMNCIKGACGHKKCACQGFNQFHKACTDMASLCPGIGMTCSEEGKATCGTQEIVMAAPPPAPAPREAAPASSAPAVPAGEGFFPVPTTSRCVVIICCQYMLVFVCLAFIRSYHELSGTASGMIEKALRGAAQTVAYGPMLSVLFIACRMRVEFLTDGKGQPQMWVQNCMYATSFGLLGLTLVVLVLPIVTGKAPEMKNGELEKTTGGGTGAMVLNVVRYAIQLCIYGGIAGVIVGINTYLPEGETDVMDLPKPAPAVMCTMILVVVFFTTQLVVAAARSYSEFTGKDTSFLVSVMQGAADTVAFAPMIAILFLAARMRALQHNSQPEAWAQNCMYASTYALICTTALAVIVPVALGGTLKTDEKTGATKFVVPNPSLKIVFTIIKYLTILGMYGGACGVIYSIYIFKAPAGQETLPVSPAVQCVVNLCVQYFFIYMVLNIFNTIYEGGSTNRFYVAIDAARATVAFAPMLAILFVTTRMYALLLTNKKGAPQRWVQDAMFMCTWSLLLSFCLCVGTGLAMGDIKTDEDGNVVAQSGNKIIDIAINVCRYLLIIMLYGGIAIIIYGLFTMTKETANGKGSMPWSSTLRATPIGGVPR